MRYLPLTDADRRAMLSIIGVEGVDELFRDVPEQALLDAPVELPVHQGEMAVERFFKGLAAKNLSPSSAPCFLGAGMYRHHVPAAVDHLVQRGEFLTAYTPYQPEVSQGTLQTLFEFQTQVAMITGTEVANASMYDGATAAAEAAMMAARVTRRNKVVLSGALHPHYREVVETHARFLGIEVVMAPPDWRGEEDLAARVDESIACLVVQTPDLFGRPRDVSGLSVACHEAGALLVAVVTEAVSLGALRSPGEMGADIVAGEGQSLGNALNFGGPTVGLLAGRMQHVRQMPGRLVGETEDVDGRRGFVLTLNTREQHIRREKATSNICTNSGLCALAFSIHLTLLGEEGFRRLARLNHARALRLYNRLEGVKGVEHLNDAFFNEFTVRLTRPAAEVVEELADEGILAGVPLSRFYPGEADMANLLLLCATETVADADIDALAQALEGAL